MADISATNQSVAAVAAACIQQYTTAVYSSIQQEYQVVDNGPLAVCLSLSVYLSVCLLVSLALRDTSGATTTTRDQLTYTACAGRFDSHPYIQSVGGQSSFPLSLSLCTKNIPLYSFFVVLFLPLRLRKVSLRTELRMYVVSPKWVKVRFFRN